jgi:2,3-bisphosphoglycerate-dependent phosphoglycerate mutase
MTAPPSTVVTLSRHGQTPWHAENRYCGSSDVGLTAVGEQQATRLAEWAVAARPDAVVSSPMRRCRETAAPATAAIGAAEPVVVDELREVHFGIAEARTLDEVEADHPGTVAAFRSDPVRHAFPGSEPPADAARRVAAVLRGLAAAHPGDHLLVVAHNTALRLTLCLLLGIDLSHYRRVFPRIDNGALTRLRVPTDGQDPPALLGLNLPLDRSPEDLS